jgi:hypothetical protein
LIIYLRNMMVIKLTQNLHNLKNGFKIVDKQ